MTAPVPSAGPFMSPIDQVLEGARLAFEEQMRETLERAAKIRTALDAYVHGVELVIAADLARRIGVEPPGSLGHGAMAQAVLDLVLGLPELRVVAGDRTVESGDATKTSPVERKVRPRSDFVRYEAGPEAKALWDEVGQLDASNCSRGVFKPWAAELAARARILQDRGDEAEDIPGRVIRKLSALRHARGITGIYGLAHEHKADWQELAKQARTERERLQGRHNGLTQKLSIPEAIVRQVERESSSNTDEPASEDAGQVEELPRLQAASKVWPVVLVGGRVENKKLELIQKRFGFEAEWVETENGVRGVQTLEGRILDGNVTAVVVLDGLISHRHFDPLVAATRQTGTPFAYGATAGSGSLRKAFLEIEEKLGVR